jgi:hypothetical protein
MTLLLIFLAGFSLLCLVTRQSMLRNQKAALQPIRIESHKPKQKRRR